MYQRKHLIVASLAHLPPEEAQDVLEALERLEGNPYDPAVADGFPRVHRARGAARRAGAEWVAELPHNFKLTYTVRDRVPPSMIQVIQVQSFLRLVIPELEDDDEAS